MKQEASLIEMAEEYIASDKTILLPFDRNALRIQQEVGREEPNLQLVEKLIVSDPALTSQVLRMSNSAFYRGLKKVTTVRNAINRIGFLEIANVVSLVTHRKNFQSNNPMDRELLGKLWSHSVGCAIGSQWIARKRGFINMANEAFIAGLLHDVGKLFLITIFDDIVASKRVLALPSPELISELMETMHVQYGHALLEKWNLPNIYCEVVLKHHDETCGDENIILLMVRLANFACNKMGIGLHEDPSLLLAATPEAHSLGLSEVALAELEIKLEDSLNLTMG